MYKNRFIYGADRNLLLDVVKQTCNIFGLFLQNGMADSKENAIIANLEKEIQEEAMQAKVLVSSAIHTVNNSAKLQELNSENIVRIQISLVLSFKFVQTIADLPC